MRKKWLLLPLALLILLPVLGVAGLCWLGATEGGTRWLVARVQPLLPQGITWGSLQGELLGELQLRGLQVQQPGLALTVDSASLNWRPARLWQRQVVVESLHLQGLRVVLSESDAAQPPSEPFDPTALDLPVDVILHRATVTDIEVAQAAVGAAAQTVQAPQRVDRLQLDELRLLGSQLTLARLALDAPQGGVSAVAELGLRQHLPMVLNVDWHWQLPDQRRGAGQLSVQGDLRALQLRHRGGGDMPINLQAELRDVLGLPAWSARLDWPALVLASAGTGSVNGSGEPGDFTLAPGWLQTEGSLDAFQLALQTAVSGIGADAVAVALQGSGNSESLALSPLQLESGNYQLRISGPLNWRDGVTADLSLAATGVELQALNPQLPDQASIQGQLRAHYRDGHLDVPALQLALGDSPLRLNATAAIDLPADAEPVVDARLQWQALAWPLPIASGQGEPEAAFASPQGELVFSGSPADWQLTLAAAMAGTQLPPGQWQAAASGDTRQLQLQALRGDVLSGELLVSGTAGWAPQVRWDLAVSGKGLEPGPWQPALAGRMDFALRSAGALEEAGPQAALVLEHLRGALGGQPLSGEASATVTGDALNLKRLALRNGDNRLDASGSLSSQALALDWSLAVPQPENLAPQAAGNLQAQGHIGGSAQAPRVQASLQGSALAWQDISLSQLSAQLDAGLAADAPLVLDVQLGPLEQGGIVLLDSAQLSGEGSTGGHSLTLTLRGESQALHTQLNGALAAMATGEQGWQGQLAQLEATAEGLGHWRLKAPAPLLLAARQASLQNLCIDGVGNSQGSACLSGQWSADTGSAGEGRLDGLSLGQWLPDLEATLSGQFQGALAADGRLQGHGEFAVSPGQVRVASPAGVQVMPHGGGRARVDVGEQGLAAFVSLQPLESGYVGVTVALPELDRLPLAEDQPLSGSVQASLGELGGLQAWLPQVEDIQGRLDADLLLSGTLAQPLVAGDMMLAGGGARVPAAGLNLADLTLHWRDDPARPGWLAVDGSVRSGPGSLALSGALSMRSGATHLSLQGEQMEVFNTDDGRVLLSPDLQIDWADQLLRLRGQVVVPRANLTPRLSISPGVAAGDAAAVEDSRVDVALIAPSPDVVILGAETAPEASNQSLPFRLDSDVELVLGDRIQVNAVGLKARLAGRVRFINRPGQRDLLPMADGQLTVEDGTFRAFGQDLDIQTGRVRFDRVPVSEPEINLRAVRWIDNDPLVSAAGVEVTGTLDQPRMDLFSRPQLDPAEIQSYLLTGRSEAGADSLQLYGTYLHPKLYVGFGFNLLEETGEFNALYTITPRYGIEANVGEADNNINLTITHER
ncbi:translocation/assembly module TamB domain-containing protein [Parahaliea mediterranea]|uniref:translocation/assembly module TamB domain-containing protein n=1 Tax=Parahaliea mediterranea TaxID=651086 RepID=UPI001300B545|nr:translocation/assembly module TamB domain-containing protein [Parahaliea mediterranea]